MSLRRDTRPNAQLKLDFPSTPTGEAQKAETEAVESRPAVHATESPASTNRLMEEACERENLKEALRRVKANKGSPGVDGMTIDEITDYLKQHWPAIREQLLSGTYQPPPVKRVEIPKPDGGGVRKLGIPTVLDRLVQQAVLQVLQKRWDRSPNTATVFDRGAARGKRCTRRSSTLPKDTAGWWISIWRNSWIHVHNAPLFMK